METQGRLTRSSLVLLLVAMFIWSIVFGRKQAVLTAKDEVFGDPQRTRGGWYWALSGVATLMLIWFYFSWGIGRAYFPMAANEMAHANRDWSEVTAKLAIVEPLRLASNFPADVVVLLSFYPLKRGLLV